MQEIPLTYVPPNPVQLSTDLKKCKLVFRRIAFKGSTDKKELEKGPWIKKGWEPIF